MLAFMKTQKEERERETGTVYIIIYNIANIKGTEGGGGKMGKGLRFMMLYISFTIVHTSRGIALIMYNVLQS